MYSMITKLKSSFIAPKRRIACVTDQRVPGISLVNSKFQYEKQYKLQVQIESKPQFRLAYLTGKFNMDNRTLRDWKIYRQFRKTLDTICSDHDDQTWLLSAESPGNQCFWSPDNLKNDSNYFSQLAKSFDDLLEITSIEDEGEVLDGEDHILLQKFNEKLELKTFFEIWKDAVQLSATKRRKAEFYDRFTTMERTFKAWKNVTKDLKHKREEDKWFKAVAFDETRLVR